MIWPGDRGGRQRIRKKSGRRHSYHWNSDIEQGPDGTFGKWIASTDTKPFCQKTIALVPDEAEVVLYLLGLEVSMSTTGLIQPGKSAPVAIARYDRKFLFAVICFDSNVRSASSSVGKSTSDKPVG